MSDKRVLGVLAGRDQSDEALARWAEGAERIIAADSAADRLLALGLRPHVVVGDMDSTELIIGQSDLDMRLDEDQEGTDCDKLLALALEEGAKAITLVGVEGDRLDHVMSTIMSAARSPLSVRLGLRKGVGHVLKGPVDATFFVGLGRRFSLLPITLGEGIHIAGAVWPLTDTPLDPLGQISISNRAAQDLISISARAGVMLLLIEYAAEELPVW